jgi:hypothetical protein
VCVGGGEPLAYCICGFECRRVRLSLSLSLSLSSVCYALLDRGICDELITHQEEPYVLCVCVCVCVVECDLKQQ